MANNVEQFRNLSNLEFSTAEGVAERNVAKENVISAVSQDLGKPGTFDLPADNGPNQQTPPTPAGPTAPIPDGMLNRGSLNFKNKNAAQKYDKLLKKGYSSADAQQLMGGAVTDTSTSLFKNQGTAGPGGGIGAGKQTGNNFVLDPDKAKAAIENTSGFRQLSRMTAENEQLLARSGPLWDEIKNMTQLPIIEGAAAAQRENAEGLRSAIVKGGGAKRSAYEAVAKMRMQEKANMDKGQALASAHMDLLNWTRQQATSTMQFADGWMKNQAGVRDSFNNAMDNAAYFMGSTAIPFMFTATQQAQAYRDANSAAQRSKVNKWISGTVGLVAGAIGEVYHGGSGKGISDFGNIGSQGSVPESMINQTAYAGKGPSNSAGSGWSTGSLAGDVSKGAGEVGSGISNAAGYVFGGL